VAHADRAAEAAHLLVGSESQTPVERDASLVVAVVDIGDLGIDIGDPRTAVDPARGVSTERPKLQRQIMSRENYDEREDNGK